MATEKIKGLTVQIGGDTSKLGEALQTLAQKSKATSKELADINRALKLDPTNTDLLAQKQQVLAEQISATKDKVDILRQAQQQAAEQLKNGDIGADEYRKLQREVIFAEQKLNSLEQQANDVENALRDAGDATADAGQSAADAAKDTDDMTDSVGDLSGSLDELQGKATIAGKELATMAGVGKALKEGVSSAMDYNSALASIQAQTGASEGEMRNLKAAMDAVYSGGYGEDLDDVASTMAQIAQSTHETDPGKLQQLAEGALTLRDTFGFDTTESLRAVNMLMEQFGVSAEQAYSLVVQGAQKGLNKNGDMMDVINEYAVHYRQMGYSADEFFASLENGTAAGTFSVDKLGDAMKEFGIRTKDTATTTDEAYMLLGLDADKLRAQFAAGGQSARDATQLVLSSLMAMGDQVTQNQIGVDLFGTMWEDLGIDGVKALTNVSGSIDITRDSMGELKKIKYSDVKTEWEALGRSVQVDLVNPLGQKALPIAKKFVTWTKDNLNKLIPIVETVGVVFATMFVVSKVSAFISSVKGLVSAYRALRTAVQAANTTMLSNPYTAIAMAIAAVVAATVSLISYQKQQREAHDALIESYRDVGRAAEESRQKQITAAKITNEEYDYYDDLWTELQTLVDANGKVIEGNEQRVEFIRSVLSEATGEEIELVDGVIQKYDDLTTSISNALEMERARALQSGMQSAYDEAKTAIAGDETIAGSQAYYEAANKAVNDTKAEIEAAERKYSGLQRTISGLKAQESLLDAQIAQAEAKAGSTIGVATELKAQLAQVQQEIKSAEAASYRLANPYTGEGEIQDLKNALADNTVLLENAAYAYDVNMATVENFEALQEAILSGNTEGLVDAMYQASNSVLSAEKSSISSLQRQQQAAEDAYDKLVAYSKQSGSKVTDKQLNDALRLKANTAIESYKGLIAAGHDTSSAELQALRKEIGDDLVALGDYTHGQLAGVFANLEEEARGYGSNFGEGFASGIEAKISRAEEAGRRMAKGVCTSTKSVLLIKSPSRVARDFGGYYSEGFALGVEDKTGVAINKVRKMSEQVVDVLRGTEMPDGGYSLPAPLMERYGGSSITTDYSALLDKLDRIYGVVAKIDPRLVLDDDTLIARTAGKYDRALGQRQILSDRGAL